MRLVVLILLASCNPLRGDSGVAPEQSVCQVDEDCVALGVTCCGCPMFAVTHEDSLNRACDGVTCPPPHASCPDNVRPACGADGACRLACLPVACETTCEHGYAIEENGCLSCTCATPAPDGCQVDSDCVRTRNDCCGCARGGRDFAILASLLDPFEQALECPDDPACPDINVCGPEEPHCTWGQCRLVAPGAPVGACGRPDLPACPAGEACTVNLNEQADLRGIGVCAPR
ncbi:MAG: hypothetical protein ACTHU0_00080 [Kofleriaceae bacterium]